MGCNVRSPLMDHERREVEGSPELQRAVINIKQQISKLQHVKGQYLDGLAETEARIAHCERELFLILYKQKADIRRTQSVADVSNDLSKVAAAAVLEALYQKFPHLRPPVVMAQAEGDEGGDA